MIVATDAPSTPPPPLPPPPPPPSPATKFLHKYGRAILLVLCGVAWTGCRYAYLTSPDGTDLLLKFRSCGGAAQDTQKHALVRWFIPTNLSVGYDLSKNSSFHARGLGKFTRGPGGLAFWDSKWASMWFWWAHQLLTSPQRVHSYEDADFVFVPVCWGDCDEKDPTVHANDVFQRLSEPGVLPYLGKLPHLVVFAYALPDYYLTLPEFKNFYFVALECMGGCPAHHGSPLLHRVISMPYISKEHPNLCASRRRFDPGPKRFAVGLFVDRDPPGDVNRTRHAVAYDCRNRPSDCTFIEWGWGAFPASQAAELYSMYYNYEYCLQPTADFVLRNAMYDCLVAGGIPVVFDARVLAQAAFNDVIDYRSILVQLTQRPLNQSEPDYVTTLRALHNQTERLAMRAAIHDLRHVFVYAQNPDHTLVSFATMHQRDPRDDAFTFTLKAFLRRVRPAPAGLNK
jgi:hypothetical protein